jgi:hypothetical protein
MVQNVYCFNLYGIFIQQILCTLKHMLYMYVTQYILRLWSYGIWHCCPVYGYHHSAVTYYHHIPYLVHLNPEDGGHIIFQNAGILPPDCKMSHSWRYAVLVFTTIKNPQISNKWQLSFTTACAGLLPIPYELEYCVPSNALRGWSCTGKSTHYRNNRLWPFCYIF